MTRPAAGDIVMFTFKVGNDTKVTCQRPAVVLYPVDDKVLNLSVFVDKRWDGQLGLSQAEMAAGIAYRGDCAKGNGDGQWAEKGS